MKEFLEFVKFTFLKVYEKKIFCLGFSFQNLEDLKISMHLLPPKNQTEKAESFDYLFYDGNQDNLATREKRVSSKVFRILTKLLISNSINFSRLYNLLLLLLQQLKIPPYRQNQP